MRKVEQFVQSSPALQSCMKRLGKESTKRGYAYHFYNYFTKYIIAKKLFSTPDEMLRQAEQCSSKELYQHLDWLEDYVKISDFMKGTTVSHRSNVVKAVRSFYAENRLPLPRYIIRYGEEVPRGRGQEALSLEEVEKVISRANDRDKAIFLTMLQGGIGPAELVGQFNLTGYRQIVKQIGELDKWQPSALAAVRIDLVRKKTGGYRFYTFISNDALLAIKHWLLVRGRIGRPFEEGAPLFITNHGDPITQYHLQKQMRINRAPWEPEEDDGTMSKFHPHELRDTFESTCAVTGVDKQVREFFLGHNIDRLGYDKSPKLYPEHFKLQYMKAAKMLNIISKPKGPDTELFLNTVRAMASNFGVDPMKVRIEKQRELGRKPTVEEEIEALNIELKTLKKAKEADPKKIVNEKELQRYLAEGWDVQTVLPSGKVLIRRSTSN